MSVLEQVEELELGHEEEHPLHLYGKTDGGDWSPFCGAQEGIVVHPCFDWETLRPDATDMVDNRCPGCGRRVCSFCLLLYDAQSQP